MAETPQRLASLNTWGCDVYSSEMLSRLCVQDVYFHILKFQHHLVSYAKYFVLLMQQICPFFVVNHLVALFFWFLSMHERFYMFVNTVCLLFVKWGISSPKCGLTVVGH